MKNDIESYESFSGTTLFRPVALCKTHARVQQFQHAHQNKQVIMSSSFHILETHAHSSGELTEGSGGAMVVLLAEDECVERWLVVCCLLR